MPLEPIDLREIDKRAGNIYEAIVIAGRKARDLNDEVKLEFENRLKDVVGTVVDDDAEDFNNPQQRSLSAEFEKRDKPHIHALKQFLNDEIEYTYKGKEK
ncbi:MAG: DNA-directed RNA polymerase subunit omega [Ignavibacteriales bacterium]|nr:hypothetical protein [Ignavibacteriaceae bacterium]MCK6614504.1 DNA-directed RNA polymerase subunit omega [Ignavibacteriaceae bacterium]QOJ29763.1 MAG: DNA-directed RNA polymerase subunit omega [Ignavibacteriales bacterium]